MKLPENTFFMFVLSVLLGCLTSCTIGGNLSNQHVVYNPSGDTAVVQILNGKRIEGELLGVDEQYVFVLTFVLIDDSGKKQRRKQIGQLPVDRVKSLRIGGKLYRFPRAVRPDRLEKMALKSRYPQGISEQLLADLLDVYEQNEINLIN